MKFCTKILVLAIIASSGALISCSSSASYSYQNVSVGITFAEVGYAGNFTVNAPGDGGITGTVLPQCPTATSQGCSQNGTEYCSPSAICSTTSAVLIPSGGGAGTCVTLYAAVTNAPANVTWSIAAYTPGQASVGGFNSNGGVTTITGPTAYYCEPSNPTIYSGTQLAAAIAAGIVDPNGNIAQGTTEVIASVPADPSNPSNVATAHMFFSYQAGTTSAIAIGESPNPNQAVSSNAVTSNIIVPRGTTQVFTGYVVGAYGYGNPCNLTPVPATSLVGTGIIWGIGASNSAALTYTPGSTPTLGTIVATGPNTALYTAPATPPSPNTVVVNAKSAACYNPSPLSQGIYTGGSNALEGASTTITIQ